eukprot:c9013_g1_i1.p1 GENE.c9013_g1_i1~~c9013_g1_i1.p1  ORF type:complete len:656 (+),score=176.02 c9013_g1_i1:48-1970(+)
MGRERKRRSAETDSQHSAVTTLQIEPSSICEAFQRLNELRQKGTLVDIKFHVQGEVFGVHKCVMAAFSEPMTAMFDNGMKESHLNEITLDDTDPRAFSLLLDYMYGQPIRIRSNDIVNVIGVAAKWGLPSLRDACSSRLTNSIDSISCCDVLCVADAFGCEVLRERAMSYVFCNFAEVSCSSRFLDLPLDTVKEIISSERLWRYDESLIFDAAARWVQGQDNWSDVVGEVVGQVRLALVPPAQLVQVVKAHPIMQHTAAQALYNQATENLALVLGKQKSLDEFARRCLGARMVSTLCGNKPSNAREDSLGNVNSTNTASSSSSSYANGNNGTGNGTGNNSNTGASSTADGIVYSLAFCDAANVVVAGFESGLIRAWSVQSWECVGTVRQHRKAVGTIAYLGNNLIVSGSHDCSMCVWDISTWECERTISGHHSQGVWALAVVNQNTAANQSMGEDSTVFDAPKLISGSYDTTIKVWDTTTWECERTIFAHEDEIETLKVHHNMLFSAADDKTIKVWNMQTWECEQVLMGHADAVMALVVVADSNALVSSSQDGTIRVWNMDTWSCEHVIQPQATARTLALINRKLISGGVDGAISMWSTDTWQRERLITQGQDEVETLLVVNGFLVSGSGAGAIRGWELL